MVDFKKASIYDRIFSFIMLHLGVVLSIPVIIFTKLVKTKVIKIKFDDYNRWSYGHITASLLLSVIFSNFLDIYHAALYAFLVMYAWDLFIDGLFKWSDTSFSVMDIGADAIGSLLFILGSIIKII